MAGHGPLTHTRGFEQLIQERPAPRMGELQQGTAPDRAIGRPVFALSGLRSHALHSPFNPGLPAHMNRHAEQLNGMTVCDFCLTASLGLPPFLGCIFGGRTADPPKNTSKSIPSLSARAAPALQRVPARRFQAGLPRGLGRVARCWLVSLEPQEPPLTKAMAWTLRQSPGARWLGLRWLGVAGGAGGLLAAAFWVKKRTGALVAGCFGQLGEFAGTKEKGKGVCGLGGGGTSCLSSALGN